jgi:hypothetical protein
MRFVARWLPDPGTGAVGAGPAASQGRAGQMTGAVQLPALLIQRSPDTATCGVRGQLRPHGLAYLVWIGPLRRRRPLPARL